MPTYPSFEQAEGSQPTVRDGMMVRTATNGASRARALSSTSRFDLTLIHLALTPIELAELKAFEAGNRGVAFAVEYWGEADTTLSCIFRSPPYSYAPFVMAGGALRYKVQVYLQQAD